MLSGVEGGGRLDDAGQQRTLLHRQRLDGLVEVGGGGGGDTVGAAAEVDGVEVGLEDLVLGPLVRHLGGDDDLFGLALVGGRVTDHRVLDVLLRDGGAAARAGLAGDLPDHRAADAGRVVALVGVEGAVLGGDDRVAHVDGHHVELDERAVALGRDDAADHRGAVALVDLRDLLRADAAGLGDLGAVVGHDRDRQGDDEEDDGEEDHRRPDRMATDPTGLFRGPAPALVGGLTRPAVLRHALPSREPIRPIRKAPGGGALATIVYEKVADAVLRRRRRAPGGVFSGGVGALSPPVVRAFRSPA